MLELLNYARKCNQEVNEIFSMTVTGFVMIFIAVFFIPKIPHVLLLESIFDRAFLPLSGGFFLKLDFDAILTFILFFGMIALMSLWFLFLLVLGTIIASHAQKAINMYVPIAAKCKCRILQRETKKSEMSSTLTSVKSLRVMLFVMALVTFTNASHSYLQQHFLTFLYYPVASTLSLYTLAGGLTLVLFAALSLLWSGLFAKLLKKRS